MSDLAPAVDDMRRQAFNVLTFVAVMTANGLAGAGAISGESIGVIANRYRSYFLPADYVFAIWSLIYLMLLVFIVYQALPGNRARPVLRRVGWWWSVNGVLNIAWVTTFSFGLFGLSLIIMLGLLGTLIGIHVRVGLDEHLTWSERVSVSYPFGLYLSWICIAVIANTFQFVTYMEWSWLGIHRPVWSAIMAVVATAVSIVVVWKRGLWIFPLVVAWALAGIAVRFGDIPVIARTGWAMVALALVTVPVALRFRWVRRASSVAMAIILISGATSGATAQSAVLRGPVVDNAG
ncbi:MAG: tryptophan-rich sensory protein [Gemmatimonadota bacterium]|jgi:benzodiazapine receptor